MRGEAPKDVIEPDINLPVPAYLPEIYVPDVHQRLVLYKRFSQVVPLQHGVLLNGRAAVETRLLPGDVIDVKGTTFRFAIK